MQIGDQFITTVRVRPPRAQTLDNAGVSREVGQHLVEVTCYGAPVALVRPRDGQARTQVVWQVELARGGSAAITDAVDGAVRLMQLAHKAGYCVARAA